MGVKTSKWKFDKNQDVYIVFTKYLLQRKKENLTVKKHGRNNLHQVTISNETNWNCAPFDIMCLENKSITFSDIADKNAYSECV